MALPPPSLTSTVVVTGASAGIGAELARALAARGYGLTLVARREDRLAALAAELRAAHGVEAETQACDLADAAARERLIATVRDGEREVVGLCNNAGLGSVGRFHALPLRREREQVRINVDALHHLTGALLPDMVARGAGAVLNVSSLAGFQPLPGMATYAATKAFVTSFSEAVHAELAGTGVSVTAVCPGPVHTEFGALAGAPEGELPGVVYTDAGKVAREAVDAMLAGRRSVVPGPLGRVAGLGGRLVPRSLLLPAARGILARRVSE